jgi:hypothetical protein
MTMDFSDEAIEREYDEERAKKFKAADAAYAEDQARGEALREEASRDRWDDQDERDYDGYEEDPGG